MSTRSLGSDRIDISKNNDSEYYMKTFANKFGQYFREYCEYTGIHGFKYFGENRTMVEKLSWIVIVISSLITCTVVTFQTYQKWQDTPIIINFATEENFIYEIPFPAVTICNEVKISKQYFNYSHFLRKAMDGDKIDPNNLRNLQDMSLLCSQDGGFYEKVPQINFTDENFYTFLEKGIVDFFEECIWMGKTYPCYEIFQLTVTDEGVCMTFNMIDKRDIYENIVHPPPIKYKLHLYHSQPSVNYSFERGYSKFDGIETYPRRALISGSTNALIVNMRVNQDDLDYACTKSQGFQVVLHKAIRYPIVQQHYFRVPLGKSVVVAISPNQMITSENVKGYSVAKRKCYFQDEKKLKYFKHYTQYNCKLECLTDLMLNSCGCVAYYMPRRNDTTICGIGQIPCMKGIHNSMDMAGLEKRIQQQRGELNHDNSDNMSCLCNPMCATVEYNTEITENDLSRYKECEALGCDIPIKDEKKISSQLVVYFKSNHFMPQERNIIYGHLDFVANIGGLLGLFVGFSLLSFWEILYFFTFRIVCNLKLYNSWYGKEVKQI